MSLHTKLLYSLGTVSALCTSQTQVMTKLFSRFGTHDVAKSLQSSIFTICHVIT